jgi:hypothetical protein
LQRVIVAAERPTKLRKTIGKISQPGNSSGGVAMNCRHARYDKPPSVVILKASVAEPANTCAQQQSWTHLL